MSALDGFVRSHDQRRRTNARAIAELVRLGRLRDDDRVLDTTFGLGRFWSEWEPGELVAGDIDPARARDVRFDATVLPFSARSFDVVVWDPPYKLVGTSRMAMDGGYGVGRGGYVKSADVAALIVAGTLEALRVSRRAVLVKCMDQVSSGRQHWQTVDVHIAARAAGAVVVEEIHVFAPVPQRSHGRQVHARGRPSTLLVLEVGR